MGLQFFSIACVRLLIDFDEKTRLDDNCPQKHGVGNVYISTGLVSACIFYF